MSEKLSWEQDPIADGLHCERLAHTSGPKLEAEPEMATTEAILRSFPDNVMTVTVLTSTAYTRPFTNDSCLPADLPAVTVQGEIKAEGFWEDICMSRVLSPELAALDSGAPGRFCCKELPDAATGGEGDALDFLGLDIPSLRYSPFSP